MSHWAEWCDQSQKMCPAPKERVAPPSQTGWCAQLAGHADVIPPVVVPWCEFLTTGIFTGTRVVHVFGLYRWLAVINMWLSILQFNSIQQILKTINDIQQIL